MNNKLQISTIKNIQWLQAWTKEFCPNQLLSRAGISKRSGHHVGWLMRLLIILPFTDVNVYKLQGQSNQLPERSAIYGFLAQTRYQWDLLLLHVAQKFIGFLQPLTLKAHDRVLIVDDSPYKRDRSKAVELLGKQFDHSENRYYRGFRNLTIGWSDGHSFVPLFFELLSNRISSKRIDPEPVVDG